MTDHCIICGRRAVFRDDTTGYSLCAHCDHTGTAVEPDCSAPAHLTGGGILPASARPSYIRSERLAGLLGIAGAGPAAPVRSEPDTPSVVQRAGRARIEWGDVIGGLALVALAIAGLWIAYGAGAFQGVAQ